MTEADLALLNADERFSSLPIVASRSASLGDTVFTLGFPDPGLQGFAPKLAKGEIASLAGAGMMRGIFRWRAGASKSLSLTLTLSRWEREQPLDNDLKFER